MNRGTGVIALLTLFCIGLSGCKPNMSDRELKGVLVVDKSQYGNDKLEVVDQDSKIYRFIYPGRKILKIDQGLQNFEVTIMEAGRAKLARFVVPMKFVTIKEKNFFIEGRKIDQTWNLVGDRVQRILQVEYVEATGAKPCTVNGQPGLSGYVWRITDSRFDYVVRFVSESTGKDIGRFDSTGEYRTTGEQINLGGKCEIRKTTFDIPEAFI